MPRGEDMDQGTRERLRAWLRYYKARRSWTNDRLAAALEIAEPTLTNALNGKSLGLDLFIKMHRHLKRSADDFLDTDPPPLPPPET